LKTVAIIELSVARCQVLAHSKVSIRSWASSPSIAGTPFGSKFEFRSGSSFPPEGFTEASLISGGSYPSLQPRRGFRDSSLPYPAKILRTKFAFSLFTRRSREPRGRRYWDKFERIQSLVISGHSLGTPYSEPLAWERVTSFSKT